MDVDVERASTTGKFLGTMARNHRADAGIFLLGLMRAHGGDLTRMTVLVRAVSLFPSEAAAEVLKAEIYHVPSSSAALAADEKVSVKWRRRFEEPAWGLDG